MFKQIYRLGLVKGVSKHGRLLGLILVTAITGCGGGNSSSSGSSPSSSPSTPSSSGSGTTSNSNSGNGNTVLPGFAELNWGANSETDLSGYRVYYGTSSGSYEQAFGQGVNVGDATSFSVNDLASGQRYYFAITAYDTSGNESGYSNEVSKDIP